MPLLAPSSTVRRPALATLAALSLALACRDGGAPDRAPAAGPAGDGQAFDWSHPEAALAMSADDAAKRIGSLELEAVATWSVGRGPGSRTLAATERHRVRQSADGEFEVETVVDPGAGPAAEEGRRVVFAGGNTYAKSRWAPFRERPTDRGEVARRSRDESFRLAHDLLGLLGPSVSLREAGGASVLGRPTRRFEVVFDASKRAEPPPPPRGRRDDPDTRARVELIEAAVPLAAEGEVLLDGATAVPLRVHLRAALGAATDPALRADVEVDARIAALGARVAAVRAPAGALPDERKPKGPARALEAAGLRAVGRAEPTGERPAPQDEAAEQ